MGQVFIRTSQPGQKTGERRMSFVASDATRDTYHTVLSPEGWQLDRFNRNPVIGYQHELQFSGDPDSVIGKGHAYMSHGTLMVDIEFEPGDINPMAEKIWKKLEFGTLNAVSVGFLPVRGHWGSKEEGPGRERETYYYDEMELLEVSVVNVPANPNALKNAMKPEEDRLAEERAAALEAERQAQEEVEPEPEPEPEEKEEVEEASVVEEEDEREAEALELRKRKTLTLAGICPA